PSRPGRAPARNRTRASKPAPPPPTATKFASEPPGPHPSTIPRTSVYTRRHPARNAGGSSCCYPPPMLEVGAARTEITAYEPRLGMMGWAMLHNFVERVATPLHARAFFLRDPDTGRTQAIAICELAFITLALRQE